MPSEFTHLHFHSHYSLLDGAIKIEGLGDRLKDLGFDSCALTDHGNLFGAIEFHNELRGSGLKPIIGMEAYIAKVNRFHRAYSKPGPNANHTVLLCQNRVGYRNLVKIASLGFGEGKYYGKPRVDHEILERHHEGLIALSACVAGELAERILEGKREEAVEVAKWYRDLFQGRYYIELQANTLPQQETANLQMIEIARGLDIPLVGTCDCHYPTREDAEAQYILQLMGWQKKITDADVKPLEMSELYIKSPDEVKEAFRNLPQECLANARSITEQCDLEIVDRSPILPVFPVAKGKSLERELIDQSKKGLIERFRYLKKINGWSDEEEAKQRALYGERLDFELKVINDMKYPGYFLIVSDFIKWSKSNGISVGPGRGSGAGSLVAYALEITDIDPIKYDLLFERFLNPDRISMPDFDVDFEVDGRERVIEYVRSKYGKDNVCQISSIGSLKAKGVIRAVARVLDMPYSEADKIAKLVPDDLKVTLKKVMETRTEFRELAEKGTETERKLIKIAFALEGLNNNLSTHAAGVIIMDVPISDVMPTCTPTKGSDIQSMFTMKYAEAQGAVKLDLLGLRNLSVIDKAVRLINTKRDRENQLDISLIPMDDKKTFQLLGRGDTTGVFQLESEGMKKLIRNLKPDCFGDIIALVALYRPGPLGSDMVGDYVERKHGRQAAAYPHDKLRPILKETYGVMVYQEQVMRAAQVLADFSLGSADILRRAIGKKTPSVLQKQRQKFVDGCRKNEIEADLANYIFDLIDKFGGYGFNKSHSVPYALIAYRTAWLKANFPVDFMAVLLTIERNKPDSVVKLIGECRDMGIQVLPPDINESEMIFTAHGDRIRFGLNAIKNVGESALESILKARKKQGRFESILDLFGHMEPSKVNSRVLEALIKSGAFDSLEPNRRKLLESIDRILTLVSAEKSMQIKNQISFFDLLPEEERIGGKMEMEWPDVSEWKPKWKLKFEKEALGFYISGHPLDPFLEELRSYFHIKRTSDLKEEGRFFGSRDSINICGVVVENSIRITKKSDRKMSVLTLEDLWGFIKVTVFPDLFEEMSDLLEEEELEDPVLIRGFFAGDKEDKFTHFVAESIHSLPRLRRERAKSMRIVLPDGPEARLLETIESVLGRFAGGSRVELELAADQNSTVRFVLSEKVELAEELVDDLEESIPAENLRFRYTRASANLTPPARRETSSAGLADRIPAGGRHVAPLFPSRQMGLPIAPVREAAL